MALGTTINWATPGSKISATKLAPITTTVAPLTANTTNAGLVPIAAANHHV